VKQLDASGTLEKLGGDFNVPFYRGLCFLDVKGRGGSSGYDTGVALSARGDDEGFVKENIKKTGSLKGSILLSTAVIQLGLGEIGGVLESIQACDRELGVKVGEDVKISGLWYGRLEKA